MMGAYLHIAALVAGIWAIANGVLHDAFVLGQHKGAYDRELLRLLMDGHVLITCGAVYIVSFFLLRQGNSLGAWLCIVSAASLVVYCAMIFPFLKSFGTLAINGAVLVMALARLLSKG